MKGERQTWFEVESSWFETHAGDPVPVMVSRTTCFPTYDDAKTHVARLRQGGILPTDAVDVELVVNGPFGSLY